MCAIIHQNSTPVECFMFKMSCLKQQKTLKYMFYSLSLSFFIVCSGDILERTPTFLWLISLQLTQK